MISAKELKRLNFAERIHTVLVGPELSFIFLFLVKSSFFLAPLYVAIIIIIITVKIINQRFEDKGDSIVGSRATNVKPSE